MQTRKLFLAMIGIAVAASATTVFALRAIGTGDDGIFPQADIALQQTSPDPGHGLVKVSATSAGVPTDFTQAAESTINGVVSIKSYVTPRSRNNGYYRPQPNFFSDPFFDFFFGQPQQRRQPDTPQDKEEQQQQLGLGSGVILTSDGYIVTNNHVINGADRLEVTLNDNRTFNATVIGNDEMTDLALIKIDASDLPVIPMGNSDALRVGEWVLAVGNPFGLTSTVTSGIVSAKARSISDATHSRSMGVESYIQTDAAVNPGNSGAPLSICRDSLSASTRLSILRPATMPAIPLQSPRPSSTRLLVTSGSMVQSSGLSSESVSGLSMPSSPRRRESQPSTQVSMSQRYSPIRQQPRPA